MKRGLVWSKFHEESMKKEERRDIQREYRESKKAFWTESYLISSTGCHISYQFLYGLGKLYSFCVLI